MSSVAIEPMNPDGIALDDRPCEILDGLDQEKLMGTTEVDVLSGLVVVLGHFAMIQQLGKVEVEMPFDLGGTRRHALKPDLAFISYQRWPKGRKIPPGSVFRFVPDLVVEVISPSDSANEVEEKTVEYLQAGVRLVWLIYPTTNRVYVHDGSSTVRVLSGEEELDGGDVIPGFKMALAKLFEVEAESA